METIDTPKMSKEEMILKEALGALHVGQSLTMFLTMTGEQEEAEHMKHANGHFLALARKMKEEIVEERGNMTCPDWANEFARNAWEQI